MEGQEVENLSRPLRLLVQREVIEYIFPDAEQEIGVRRAGEANVGESGRSGAC